MRFETWGLSGFGYRPKSNQDESREGENNEQNNDAEDEKTRRRENDEERRGGRRDRDGRVPVSKNRNSRFLVEEI